MHTLTRAIKKKLQPRMTPVDIESFNAQLWQPSLWWGAFLFCGPPSEHCFRRDPLIFFHVSKMGAVGGEGFTSRSSQKKGEKRGPSEVSDISCVNKAQKTQGSGTSSSSSVNNSAEHSHPHAIAYATAAQMNALNQAFNTQQLMLQMIDRLPEGEEKERRRQKCMSAIFSIGDQMEDLTKPPPPSAPALPSTALAALARREEETEEKECEGCHLLWSKVDTLQAQQWMACCLTCEKWFCDECQSGGGGGGGGGMSNMRKHQGGCNKHARCNS